MNKKLSTADILIVDDTPPNLRLLVEILRNAGYNARPANNGKRALLAIEKERPDLILLDIMMPEMNGYEVCEQLKADERTRDIPVIFISALNETADKVYGFTLGGVDYITKPFQKEEVIARVQTHLAIHKLQQQLVEQNARLEQEIVERKRAEETLRVSEERFRTVADFNYDWEDWVDSTGNYVYVSPSCERITGYRADEFVQNPDLIESIIHPDDWNTFADHKHTVTETGEVLAIDFRIVTRSGEERWIGHVCQAVYSDDGRYLGQRGSNRDITERKQVEKSLRESEERYWELFDNMSSGVAVYEVMDEGQDFIFQDFNQAAERLDGDKKQDLVGKSIFDARPGVEDFGLTKVFRRVWETGQPEHYPVTLYQDEHLTGWYENFVYKLSSGEIVAVFDNITERKQAEDALRQRTAQLEALREVGLEIATQLDLDALLRSIVLRATELLGGNTGGIILYRPEQDVMEVVATAGNAPVPPGTTFPRGESFVGKVWEMGKALIVEDYGCWEGQVSMFEDLANVTVVGAPIHWNPADLGRESRGILIIADVVPRVFSQADVDLLSLFATQAAIAIENARLYTQ